MGDSTVASSIEDEQSMDKKNAGYKKRIDITPDCPMKISERDSPLSKKFSPE